MNGIELKSSINGRLAANSDSSSLFITSIGEDRERRLTLTDRRLVDRERDGEWRCVFQRTWNDAQVERNRHHVGKR